MSTNSVLCWLLTVVTISTVHKSTERIVTLTCAALLQLPSPFALSHRPSPNCCFPSKKQIICIIFDREVHYLPLFFKHLLPVPVMSTSRGELTPLQNMVGPLFSRIHQEAVPHVLELVHCALLTPSEKLWFVFSPKTQMYHKRFLSKLRMIPSACLNAWV